MPSTFLLRTCDANMAAYGGFVWPTSGPVSCPDWHPGAHCGNGLHGLLMGEGNGALLSWSEDAKWLVVAVDPVDVVFIDDEKVKVPRGDVVFCGARDGAIAFLVEKGADPAKIPCGQANASGTRGQASASGYQGQASASGDYGQANASGTRGQASASGYQGQASASGDYGQASASGTRGQASASGDYGQANASGDYGQANASGYQGQASASGDYGQANASGYQGQASASGDYGQANASGYQGQASASGDYGQANASGYQGQASASGDYGQASASGTRGQASASGTRGQASASGDYGQASASGAAARAMAGSLGIVMLTRWDDVAERERIVIGYVGEHGIEAGVWYRLDDVGAFIVAPDDEYEPFVAVDAAADARNLSAEAR